MQFGGSLDQPQEPVREGTSGRGSRVHYDKCPQAEKYVDRHGVPPWSSVSIVTIYCYMLPVIPLPNPRDTEALVQCAFKAPNLLFL